jgi:hypothetical protein
VGPPFPFFRACFRLERLDVRFSVISPPPDNHLTLDTLRHHLVEGLASGGSTASVLENRTKRSVVHNARRGIAPPPCAWSIEMGQCSGTRSPPGAVSPPRKRDQEAARSNRRASLIPVPVTSQWCAQEAADQAARTPWPRHARWWSVACLFAWDLQLLRQSAFHAARRLVGHPYITGPVATGHRTSRAVMLPICAPQI